MVGNVYDVRFPDGFSTENITNASRRGQLTRQAANCAGMLLHGERATVRPGFFSGDPDRDAQIRQELINIGWLKQAVAA